MIFKRIHFIGIGGIGMSAIAQMLTKLGCEVTGSDSRESAITRRLADMGVTVYIGHAPAHVGDAECVVYSSSIHLENCEIAEASRLGLEILHRSEMLALLSADKWTAAVSGTHGKSTTTSMLGWVYERCGKKPTVVVGAKVGQFGGGNLLVGTGPDMILEADESDGSFLKYTPDAIIITNIDSDHMDYFRDLDHVEHTFRAFLRRLKKGGRWYGCVEDPRVKRLLAADPERGVSYGFGRAGDYSAHSAELMGRDGGRFVLYHRSKPVGEVRLGLYGMHNILNATAVCALALDQGLAFESVSEAIGEYRGASRRFDIKRSGPDLAIVDDYAHHPTEILRTLEAARGFAVGRRILVVFQPHRYSRTQILHREFAAAFPDADEVIVTDIYAAGEAPIAGVSAQNMAAAIAEQGRPASFAPKQGLADFVMSRIQKGDVVMTMGAGDIGDLSVELKEAYERKVPNHV